MALLASLSSRGAYLIRELLSDRVEPAAHPANGLRSQSGCKLEIGASQVVLARVDVGGELGIGEGALLELVERADGILRGLGIVPLCQRVLHVSERRRAVAVRGCVAGFE